MMRKLFVLCVSLTVLSCLGVHAQISVNMGSQTSVTGCDINIYDDGGINGNYGPNHNYTLTIHPAPNQ